MSRIVLYNNGSCYPGRWAQASSPAQNTVFSSLRGLGRAVGPEWSVLNQGGQHHLPCVDSQYTIHMCVGLQLGIINTSNNQGWSGQQSWAQQLQSATWAVVSIRVSILEINTNIRPQEAEETLILSIVEMHTSCP